MTLHPSEDRVVLLQPAGACRPGSKRAWPRRPLLPALTAALLAAALLPASAADVSYRFVDLGALLAGDSHALDVNNAGQIVGQGIAALTGPDRAWRATLWTGPRAADRTVLGGEWSIASAINEGGKVVGYDPSPDSISKGALWRGTTTTVLPMTNAHGINDHGHVVGVAADKATLWDGLLVTYLDPPGSPWAQANDINNSGVVVGTTFSNPGIAQHATLWDGAQRINLGALTDFRYSEASSLNDAGQVVGLGNHVNGGPYYPVLWQEGTATVLGGGSYHGHADDINEAGQIVGSAWTTPGSATPNATLWSDGAMIDLNTFAQGSGWRLVWATGINDEGWIVGSAYKAATNTYHAYVLVPVPEPRTYALLAGGAFVLALMRRRSGRAAAQG